MPWTIQGGGEEQNPEGYDGRVWEWQVTADHDADEHRVVTVRVSGTAMGMSDDALPTRVAVARETLGRSEIEMTIEWPAPPVEIDIDSSGVHVAGGDPGSEQREINEILGWLEERGALVIFAARSGGIGPSTNPQWTSHSAHVIAWDLDEHLYRVESTTRLEAARAAKERWDAEGSALLAKLLQADEAVEPRESFTADREAEKTLRMEGYRVVWTEPTDPDNPIWMGQAFNDADDLLEIALGSDPQDVLLELADALLPEDRQANP